MIVKTIKDSPAEEIGLKSGDYIISVDGIEYTGEQLEEASNKLKTEEGTKAKVEILRDNEKLEFDIVRRKIKTSHVESEILENNIGYIYIPSFDEGTFTEFKEEFDTLKAKNIKSLIVDLRHNGGGIVNQATKIADMFIDAKRRRK